MSDLEIVMAIRAAVKGNVAVFYPCECDEHETGHEHFVDELAASLAAIERRHRWRIHNPQSKPNLYYVFTTENDARTAILALGQPWWELDAPLSGQVPTEARETK